MAVLVKKLHALISEGVQEDFELATTQEETGNAENFLVASVDGVTAYAGLDTDLTASRLRVAKDGTTYAVKKTGFVAGSQNYTTAGTYTFTAPFTHSYTVEVAGGGGGAGGGVAYRGSYGANGGNGGRGALVSQQINLQKGSTYNVSVGRGGAGGTGKEVAWTVPGSVAGTAGSAGGTSTFANISASGGGGGGGASCEPDDGAWRNGANGASYGRGGTGGAGSWYNGGTGGTGWVKISWS